MNQILLKQRRHANRGTIIFLLSLFSSFFQKYNKLFNGENSWGKSHSSEKSVFRFVIYYFRRVEEVCLIICGDVNFRHINSPGKCVINDTSSEMFKIKRHPSQHSLNVDSSAH